MVLNLNWDRENVVYVSYDSAVQGYPFNQYDKFLCLSITSSSAFYWMINEKEKIDVW